MTFRKSVAERIGFPLQDVFTGTRILETMKLLQESQYWDRARMEEYRLLKLQRLVSHAYDNVQFYRESFDAVKLKPSDIKTPEDIQKIPILRKEAIRERNSDFIASNTRNRRIKTGKTGGTTGAPILVYKDTADRTFTWASYYRWYGWMGIGVGDSSFTLWGARRVTGNNISEKIKDLVVNYLQNAMVINSFEISEAIIPSVIDKINRERPVLLKGYLSALLFLAEYMDKKDLHFSYPLTAVSVTSETLLPHNRDFLERIFSAPVYDQYGCGEASGIAYECSHHRGMHITREHVTVEILDDENRVVNGPGNVIVTNLDNYIMPFIRYANGDTATLSESVCSCGITLPLLASVHGRSADTVTLQNGARVHGVFFTDILYEKGILSDRIRRFQVFQVIQGEIEFRIESPRQTDPEADTILAEALGKFFSKVVIVRKEKLENEPNGKFRYIKTG